MSTVVQPNIPFTPEQQQALKQPQRNLKGQFIRKPGPPTIKQLYKWAADFTQKINTYGQTNVQHLQSIPLRDMPTPQQYANLLKDLERWNYCKNKGSQRGVDLYRSKILTPAENFEQNVIRARNFADQRAVGVATLGFRLKIIDIFNDLLLLTKSMPTIWDSASKVIKVITPAVILIDPKIPTLRYEFGTFSLWLHLGMTQYSHVKVKANCPRNPSGISADGKYNHPHLKLDTLCFGKGSISAQKAFKQGRLFDLVQIIQSVLNTYGAQHGEAPHIPIERWKGVCDVRFDPATGEAVPIDAVIPTAVTQTHPCPLCAADVEELVHCFNCQEQACIGCYERCQYRANNPAQCTARFCEDHFNVCDNCNNRFCNDHMSEDDSALCIHCYSQMEEEYEDNDEEDED